MVSFTHQSRTEGGVILTVTLTDVPNLNCLAQKLWPGHLSLISVINTLKTLKKAVF